MRDLTAVEPTHFYPRKHFSETSRSHRATLCSVDASNRVKLQHLLQSFQVMQIVQHLLSRHIGVQTEAGLKMDTLALCFQSISLRRKTDWAALKQTYLM